MGFEGPNIIDIVVFGPKTLLCGSLDPQGGRIYMKKPYLHQSHVVIARKLYKPPVPHDPTVLPRTE